MRQNSDQMRESLITTVHKESFLESTSGYIWGVCLCPSGPEMRQGSSAGNVRTQMPITEKGQRSTSVWFARAKSVYAHTHHWTTSKWFLCLFVFPPTVKDASPEELLRQLQEERTCKVCMDKLVSIVFIPCGHLVVCGDCAASLRHCPICRAVIRGSVRAFMSWGWRETPVLYKCRMGGLELLCALGNIRILADWCFFLSECTDNVL